jgi:hypothetical protein
MIAAPNQISEHLPPQARDELIRAVQVPNIGLNRVRAVELAVDYVKAKWPEFFKLEGNQP